MMGDTPRRTVGNVGNQTTKQKAASPRIEGLVATA